MHRTEDFWTLELSSPLLKTFIDLQQKLWFQPKAFYMWLPEVELNQKIHIVEGFGVFFVCFLHTEKLQNTLQKQNEICQHALDGKYSQR